MAGIAPVNTLVFNPADYINTSATAQTKTGALILGADPGGSELLRVGGNGFFNGDVKAGPGAYFYNSSGILNIRAGGELRFGSNGVDNRARITTSGDVILSTEPGGSELLRGTGGFRFTADSILTSTTDATSTTSAALIISGGIGWGATKTSYGGGLLLVSPTIGLGYATGAGGTVTQSTSKSTGVTLDKVCGTITMNAASLAADTSVSFVLTDSAIAENDYIAVQHDSGGTLGAYNCVATPAAGSATITVRNVTPGALAQAIVLRFFVNKAAVA